MSQDEKLQTVSSPFELSFSVVHKNVLKDTQQHLKSYKFSRGYTPVPPLWERRPLLHPQLAESSAVYGDRIWCI